MPINAFGGGPGSGKTYGVMEHVIIPAIAKGRFVITNIDGLEDEKIYQYVAQHHYKGKIFCIGHIRHCERSAPEREDFFPGEDCLDKAVPVPKPDAPGVVGGDLVVIDEATRYWSTGEKVSKQDAYFFREHRHFVNEMGHTCDLVVIDPDLSMLARSLKGKIELSSITRKVKELALERYVVSIYQKCKLTGKPLSVNGPYAFKKEVYSLYRSYAVAGAKEQTVDARQSLRGKIIFRMVSMLVVMGATIGFLYWAYQSRVAKLQGGKAEHEAAQGVQAKEGPRSGASEPGQRAGLGGPMAGLPGPSDMSDTLRVGGAVTIRGQRWVVVSDGQVLRLENASAFAGGGVLAVGQVEGKRVATWSGRRGEKSFMGEK